MGSLESVFPLEVIKICAKKALLGLGHTMKNPVKISWTCLKKINITSPGGAGRAVFLLLIRDGKAILVSLRFKNDKKIGANMSVENPYFRSLLNRNLDLILRDLNNEDYVEYYL